MLQVVHSRLPLLLKSICNALANAKKKCMRSTWSQVQKLKSALPTSTHALPAVKMLGHSLVFPLHSKTTCVPVVFPPHARRKFLKAGSHRTTPPLSTNFLQLVQCSLVKQTSTNSQWVPVQRTLHSVLRVTHSTLRVFRVAAAAVVQQQ